MKRILFYLFVICLLFLSVFSVILAYRNDDNSTIQIDPGEVTPVTDMDDVALVTRGTVADCLTVGATVAPANENCLTVFYIPGEKETITLFAAVGAEMKKDDKVAERGNEKYTCSGEMKCVDIQWNEDGCEVVCLDYSKLYLSAMIPVKYLQYDLFSKSYTFYTEDRSEIKAKLSYLDYIDQNGLVAAKFLIEETKQHLLPGTSVQCDTTLFEKKDALVLPLLFVMERGGQYYVEILENGNIHNQKIEIGMIGTNYVEILSGVSEGDQILYPGDGFSIADSAANRNQSAMELIR